MSSLIEIGTDDFSRVLESPRPALVEFGAPWCGPCKMLEPVLVELAADYAGRVDVFTVNVDQSPDLAMQYGVMGVPTVILFENGEPQTRITGFRPKKQLEKTFFKDL
jgi:thioredoxin 1